MGGGYPAVQPDVNAYSKLMCRDQKQVRHTRNNAQISSKTDTVAEGLNARGLDGTS